MALKVVATIRGVRLRAENNQYRWHCQPCRLWGPVTLAYELAQTERHLTLFAVNYGQRHDCELQYAGFAADHLGARLCYVDLRAGAALFAGTPLLDARLALPEAEADDLRQRATIVPNRNPVLLALAFAYATEQGADTVAVAAHGGDGAIYPDCRPAFFSAFAEMERLALAGVAAITLSAPYLQVPKSEVVKRGARLEVPFQRTWSCYAGGRLHCNRCGACRGRRAAFRAAGVPDPTAYAPVPIEVRR